MIVLYLYHSSNNKIDESREREKEEQKKSSSSNVCIKEWKKSNTYKKYSASYWFFQWKYNWKKNWSIIYRRMYSFCFAYNSISLWTTIIRSNTHMC